MANGGKITVRWSSPAAGNVSITGPSTASPAPGSITADTTYSLAEDGPYILVVTAFGATVVNRVVWLKQGQRLVFDATPKTDDFSSSIVPTVDTTTNLASLAAAVNTTGKYTGKMVYNSTTGKPVWASGALANSVWKDATGTTAHTPI